MLQPTDASRVSAIIEKVGDRFLLRPQAFVRLQSNLSLPPLPLLFLLFQESAVYRPAGAAGGLAVFGGSSMVRAATLQYCHIITSILRLRYRNHSNAATPSFLSFLTSPLPPPQLQAAPASVGLRGDDVRRVRAGGLAAGTGKSASMAQTAPAAMGGVQGMGSASAAAAAAAGCTTLHAFVTSILLFI
jgi:hypothetical protein